MLRGHMGHIPKLQDFDNPNYNPDLPDELAFGDVVDPYPRLHELAARGTVFEGDFRLLQDMLPDPTIGNRRVFIVFGYDEVREVMSNTDNFCSVHHRDGIAQTFGSHSLTVLDP